MSSSKSVLQFIKDDLAQAREYLAYYADRVQSLEQTLAELSGSAGKVKDLSRTVKATASAGKQTSNGAKRGPKPKTNGSAVGASELPSTGQDFWYKIVTRKPQSAVDIANAAALKLGLRPRQKKLVTKLKQRVAPALSSLINAQKIKDTGAGRERRFFKE